MATDKNNRTKLTTDFEMYNNPDKRNIWNNTVINITYNYETFLLEEKKKAEEEEEQTSVYPRKPEFAKPNLTPIENLEDDAQKFTVQLHLIIQLLLLKKLLDHHPEIKKSPAGKAFSEKLDLALKHLETQPQLQPYIEKSKELVEKTKPEDFERFFKTLENNKEFRQVMEKQAPEVLPQIKPLIEFANEQRFGVTKSGERVVVLNAHDVADVIVTQQGPANDYSRAALDTDTRIPNKLLDNGLLCTKLEQQDLKLGAPISNEHEQAIAAITPRPQPVRT